jgi:hypothetical protein
MRGPDVAAYLARSDAAILPLGPTEAHGLHLPLGCDHLIATATAVLAADLADALVLPPFAFSWPGATAKLPGTIRLAPDFVQSALIAVLEGAAAAGFRRLALVGAHGPDEHLATLVGRHFFERSGLPTAVHHAVPGRGTTPRERELAAADAESERDDPGQGESSRLAAALEILGLPADLVDTTASAAQGTPQPPALRDAMRRGGAGFYYSELPQHIPTPRRIDAATGRLYLEASAAAIADSLAAMRELSGS